MFKLAYKLLKKNAENSIRKKKKVNLEMVKLEEKVEWKSLVFNNVLVFLSPYILPSFTNPMKTIPSPRIPYSLLL